MRFFISGIMRGSRPDKGICDQDYRKIIKAIIKARLPEAEVIDPLELHPDSVDYRPEEGKRVLLEMAEEAARADVLIAYVPEASMGTAIEMWRAYRAGRVVLTISPLAENWVVKFFSTRVFPTLQDFEAFVADGGLEGLMAGSASVA